MAEQTTFNYGWTKPDPGASAHTWGGTLNATTDKIDAQVKANELAGVPVGSGALWFTATPPDSWIFVDNASYPTAAPYDKLFAIFGTQFNHAGDPAGTFRVPPLAGFFPVGASPAYPAGATGGAATVTLDATMIPSHAHGVNESPHSHTSPAHAHVLHDPSHDHLLGAPDPGQFGAVGVASGTGWGWGTIHVGGHVSGVTIDPATATVNPNSTGITVQTTGGGAAHNNLPPWFGVNFIIKYK